MSDKYNTEEVIDRLILEQAKSNELIEAATVALYSTGEFTGLSLVGGIKHVLKLLHEEREKNLQLEKELRTYLFKK